MNNLENIFSKNVDWNNFGYKDLNQEFIDKYEDKMNWDNYLNRYIYEGRNSYDNLKKFIPHINKNSLKLLSQNVIMSNDVLIDIDKLDKKTIYSRKDFLFTGIDNDLIDFDLLSSNPYLSSEYISKNINKLNFFKLLENQLLTNEQVQDNIDKIFSKYKKVPSTILSKYQLGKDIIMNNLNKFHIKSVVKYQVLDTKTVIELCNKHNLGYSYVRGATELDNAVIISLSEDMKYNNNIELVRYQVLRWGKDKAISLFQYFTDYEYEFLISGVLSGNVILENEHLFTKELIFDIKAKEIGDNFANEYINKYEDEYMEFLNDLCVDKWDTVCYN